MRIDHARKRPDSRTALLLVLLLSVPTPGQADDTNYQTYLLGQRAMGMGGAFTALSDQAGGEYYNPAGIGLLSEREASISHSFYAYQRRKLSGAVSSSGEGGRTADLSGSKIPTIPAAVSVATKFGKRILGIKRFTGSYSLFVPYSSDFSSSGNLLLGDDEATSDAIALDVRDTDRTLLQAGTIAMRINRKWSVGLSALWAFRSAETWVQGHRVGPQDDADLTETLKQTEARVSRSIHSLLFKAGVRYDINDNWRLGLALTSPSITLTGTGMANSTTIASSATDSCPPRCTRFRDFRGEVSADSKTPFAARLGGAFVSDKKRLTLSADVSLHAPVSYEPYDVDIESFNPNNIGDFPAGLAVISEIERKTVVNVNVGAELARPHWVLRGGFFTNFSSAPDIVASSFAQPSKVDMYGVSASVGYRWRTNLVSLGVLYSFGSGQVSGIRTPPADAPTKVFRPIGERRDFVFLFIEGAKSAATSEAKAIWDGTMKSDLPEKTPAPETKDAPAGSGGASPGP